MHIYKSRFLVRGEVWFEQEPNETHVDWVLYRQRSEPVSGASWRYFYTIVLDLSQSREELLGAMSKSAVYKIRRATERDGITCECGGPAKVEDLDQFERDYARFAKLKGLGSLDRPLLSQLAKDGFLEISMAKDAQGRPCVHHVYYRGRHRSCLMHCVSLHHELAESDAAPINRVEKLAAYFAAEIRAFRPEGSFVIAGFCAGGALAFELARQLAAETPAPDYLALFGAPYPTSYRRWPRLRKCLATQAERLLRHARALVCLPAAERRAYLAARLRNSVPLSRQSAASGHD